MMSSHIQITQFDASVEKAGTSSVLTYLMNEKA